MPLLFCQLDVSNTSSFSSQSWPCQGKSFKLKAALQEGDKVEMKGPLVKFQYKANMKKKIGMVFLCDSHMPPRWLLA